MEVYRSLLDGPRHLRGRADITMDYADCLVALGRFGEALEYYGRIEKDNSKPELLERVRFRTAQTLFYEGEFDSSRAAFLDVAMTSPNGPYVNDALAKVLLIDDSDSPGVLKHLARAEWLDYAGQADTAIAVLAAVSTMSTNQTMIGSAVLKQASILNRQGRSPESVEVLTGFLTQYPECRLAPYAQKALGETYAVYLDDRDAALDAFEQVVLLYPESVVALEVRKTLEKMRQIP